MSWEEEFRRQIRSGEKTACRSRKADRRQTPGNHASAIQQEGEQRRHEMVLARQVWAPAWQILVTVLGSRISVAPSVGSSMMGLVSPEDDTRPQTS